MAIQTLRATDVPNPPGQLGEITIRVKIGETKSITQNDLMVSNPPYYQDSGFLIGGIILNNPGKDNTLLFDPNQANNIAELFSSTGAYIECDIISGMNYWNNNIISYLNLIGGNFKVVGKSIGTSYFTYRAKAINTTASNKESDDYSEAEGLVRIIVVSTTNLPPSVVGNNTVLFTIGVPLVFTEAMFTSGTTPPYSDPENDPAYELLIKTIPLLGRLMYRGTPVKAGDIIPFSDIRNGLLQYFDYGTAAVNQNIPFQYEVSDTGSMQFKG